MLKSPTSTNVADLFKSSTSGAGVNKTAAEESKLIGTNFANEIKSIQQKIIDELKTGEQTAGTLSLLNNFKQSKELEAAAHDRPGTSTFGQSSSAYSSKFPYPTRRDLFGVDRYGRRNASETRINTLSRYGSSLSKHNLPFKSYEYESLNPVRYSDNKYHLTRPMSSVSFYENDLGLRESLIPNCMNDDELFIRSSLVSYFFLISKKLF